MIYPRFLKPALDTALTDTPVIVLSGARQCGKSTLASQCASSIQISFDDWTSLQAAKNDPESFIQGLLAQQLQNPEQGPIFIDEVQQAPEIFLPIKKAVDQNRKPGMFLLTGSANILAWDKLPNSLAGRIEYLTLYPLSLSEVIDHQPQWIDHLFLEKKTDLAAILTKTQSTKESLDNFVISGGFPEAYLRKDRLRQKAWFSSYVKTLIQRDLQDLANIEQHLAVQSLLALTALRIGSTINYAELGMKLQLSAPTVQKYLHLIELLYLGAKLPSWHKNFGKRITKSPKFYLSDPGLLAHLAQADELKSEDWGSLIEQFIFNELQKQISWSQSKPDLYYWRSQTAKEVDFVLEDLQGNVVAIEVKAAHSLSMKDFSGLKIIQSELKEQFLTGIVAYRGDKMLSFGENLYAVPITWLI